MIITCPCEKKQFEIDDKLIPEKGKLLQCGSCDRKWFFKKTIEVKKKLKEYLQKQKLTKYPKKPKIL